MSTRRRLAIEQVPNLISSRTSINQALALLDQPECGGLLVVDSRSRLVGTVELGDIRRGVLDGTPFDATVVEIMKPAPVALMDGSVLSPDSARRVFDGTFSATRIEQSPIGGRVVILAGGEGRRLRPLTASLPKPLLPVGGRPLLETTIRRLVQAGFDRIDLAVLYRSEMIESHFGDGSEYGASVNYVRETSPLGTAGAVRLAIREDPALTLVMNGDILTTLRFGDMLDHHVRRHNHMTVGMKVMEVPIPYGVLELDEHETVTAIREKPTKRYFVNAGVYVLGPEAVELIPFDRRFDMTDVISTAVSKGYRVGGFPIVEYWTDIGQVNDYKAANLNYAQYFTAGDLNESGPPAVRP